MMKKKGPGWNGCPGKKRKKWPPKTSFAAPGTKGARRRAARTEEGGEGKMTMTQARKKNARIPAIRRPEGKRKTRFASGAIRGGRLRREGRKKEVFAKRQFLM